MTDRRATHRFVEEYFEQIKDNFIDDIDDLRDNRLDCELHVALNDGP